MRLSLLVAMSEDRVIGRDGRLPWHLPADLKRFKQLTMGHHLIMGRKTFESLGRPLPGRTSIVLTRQPDFSHPGVHRATTWREALTLAGEDPEVFVIGGGEVYVQALDRVDRVYLTLVHAQVPGDTFFPAWDSSVWTLINEEPHQADARHPFAYTFRVYDRRRSPPSLERSREASMANSPHAELLRLSQQLLDTIAAGDWQTYTKLCDNSLSAFEPEARGHLVEGLGFHKYYFELPKSNSPRNSTITSPHVRLLGDDAAVVSYVRLVQYLDGQGVPQTTQFEETRVWQRRDGVWRHVHFHRSANH